MKTPAFWRTKGLLSTLLLPLGSLYGLAGKACGGKDPERAGVPVICVGNVTAGGAGKTPVVLDLMARIIGAGQAPHALSRGYGGTEKGPLRVDPNQHTACDVGDEALLLARTAPAWVSRRRVRGAHAARDAGASVIVMDDGFQNPALYKDVSLLVVDGGFGFGNGRLIPAGPLREPLARALARADAAVLMGADETGVEATVRALAPTLPLLRARLEPAGDSGPLHGRPLFAFAGIGRPEKFFATLQAAGLDVVATRSFADHHPFTAGDIAQLNREARAKNAGLITTEKDFVRLPQDTTAGIETLAIKVVWDNADALVALLNTAGIGAQKKGGDDA